MKEHYKHSFEVAHKSVDFHRVFRAVVGLAKSMAGLRSLREKKLVQISKDVGNIAQQLHNFIRMRKAFLCFAVGLMSATAFAQKQVTVKAGTIVPLLSVNQVKAADVQEGQMVDFRVAQDVAVDGVCAIPQGTLVKGKVTEARKSTVAGTKGKLIINISSLILDTGEPLYFTSTEVRVYGHNRTPVAVVAGLFTGFGFLIPGSRAEMPAGYEVLATVAANTNVTAK